MSIARGRGSFLGRFWGHSDRVGTATAVESRFGPKRPKIDKETSHDLVSWTRSPTTSRRWRRALSDDHSRRYEEAEKQRKQAIEDAKSFEEKEQERQDAECLLMAKEDVKPEIDAALDDLGFDLLEQNIPGFDQEAADEMRQRAEEEALIKWEVGQTKPCKTRVQGAPASFGYLCSLPPPMEQGLWQAPYEVPPSWQAPRWTLVVEIWRKEMRGDLCLGEARISAGDLLLELKEVPKPPKDAATAPTSSQPAQISLPLRVRKNARKRERTRSGGSVSLHAWPPPAWAVAPSADELRMDAFEGRDNRRAPPKEKNVNVFKKVSDSASVSFNFRS